MGAFLRNKLMDEGVTASFVNELLRKCVKPALNHSAHECKWDKESVTVTTSDDASEQNKQAELESMPFFVNK